MARTDVNEGDGGWMVTAIVLNKPSRTTDKRWSFRFGVRREGNDLSL
jgi:hypothetical protein